MKKVLLGTSAIALASTFSTSANAVEWVVSVGGYMEQYAAYAGVDVDGFAGDEFDGIDNKGESEIHFKPAITLDNGIKIGADVQLEGNGFGGTPDTIDESFLFVDGSFGRVLLGSENSAGYLMNYGAPDVTFLNVNSGSLTKFVPYSGTVTNFQPTALVPAGANVTVFTGADVFRGTLGSSFIENGRNNDAQRFTYFTPRFAGFQLGLSYARDGLQDNQAQLNLNVAGAPQNTLNNIFDIGANYVNSFGGIDVAVSGRWGVAGNDATGVVAPAAGVFNPQINDNPQVWGAGLNLGFAGVTVGGSFAEQNNAGVVDGRFFDAGIAYETGPWGFSFTYANGENVDNENNVIGTGPNAIGTAPGADENLEQFLLGASYTLAKGVALNAFGAYADFDEDVGDAGGAGLNPGGDDVDGWVVGTGIKISF